MTEPVNWEEAVVHCQNVPDGWALSWDQEGKSLIVVIGQETDESIARAAYPGYPVVLAH